MIRTLIDEAVAAGARRDAACELLGLTVRTLQRWVDHDDDRRHGPNTVPANKLSEAERRKLVEVASSLDALAPDLRVGIRVLDSALLTALLHVPGAPRKARFATGMAIGFTAPVWPSRRMHWQRG